MSQYTTPSVSFEQQGLSSNKLNFATWNVNRLSIADSQRIEGIAEKIRSTDLHLIALQELTDQKTLRYLLKLLKIKQYRGFLARHIPYDLRMGFLYDPQLIDSVSAHPLLEHNSHSEWAGRTPLLFRFSFRGTNGISDFTVINIHAKADTPNRLISYQKRMRAAESLYQTASQRYAGDRIIILGDFNDDIDRSIYKQRRSPYYLFREDRDQYRIATRAFTRKNRSTTITNSQPIDHIIISDELFQKGASAYIQLLPPFMEESAKNYKDTLSDHFLVRTSIDISRKQTSLLKPDKLKRQAFVSRLQNHPNPLTNQTTFLFTLPRSQQISLSIHDLLGRRVKRIAYNQVLEAGRHELSWFPDANLASGVYQYRLETSSGERVNRLLTILR